MITRVMVMHARSPQGFVTLVLALEMGFMCVLLPGIAGFAVPFLIVASVALSGQRATIFEAALPIPARDVLLSRLLFLTAAICLPLLLWLGASALGGPQASVAAWDDGMPIAVRLAFLPIGILAALLPNFSRIGVMGVPTRTVLLPSLILGLVSAAIIYLLPAVVMLAALSLSVVVTGVVLLRRFPKSFQVAGAATAAARDRSASKRSKSTQQRRAFSRASFLLLVMRTPLLPASIVVLPVMALGARGNWFNHFGLLVLPLMMFAATYTRWMAALPISPRNMMWMRIGPFLLPAFVGLAIGAAAFSRVEYLNVIDARAPHSYMKSHAFDRHTNVRLQFWHRSPDGSGQVARSPWGEISATDTLRVLGLTLYNPYSAEKSSSKEFLEWQFGRATAAVYGKSMTLAEYDELEDGDGSLPSHAGGGARFLILSAGAIYAYMLLAAYLIELCLWHRLWRRPLVGICTWVLVVLVCFGPVLFDMYYYSRHRVEIVVELGRMGLSYLSQILPASLPVLVLLAALPSVLVYKALVWQSKRSEVRVRPGQTLSAR